VQTKIIGQTQIMNAAWSCLFFFTFLYVSIPSQLLLKKELRFINLSALHLLASNIFDH